MGGYCNHKLIAPLLLEDNGKTEVFNPWFQHMLLPQQVTGRVIVLDNAAFHQSASTPQTVGQSGCDLLYLAPYSPELNPIEKLCANLKRRWRKVGGSLEEMIKEFDY